MISHFYVSDHEYSTLCCTAIQPVPLRSYRSKLSVFVANPHVYSFTNSPRTYVDKAECNGAQHHLLFLISGSGR